MAVQLFIYPIKSLLPVEVSFAEITSEGFRFDRQYVLAKVPQDPTQRCVENLTIKTMASLSLFQPSIDACWSKLTVKHTLSRPESSVTIPLTPSPLSLSEAETYEVNILGTRAVGIDMGNAPAGFFSEHLNMDVRLLFIGGPGWRDIPGAAYLGNRLSSRPIRLGTRLQPQRLRFADAAPFLVTSEASTEEARCRLPLTNRFKDVTKRFRGNIHIEGGPDLRKFDEDNWKEISVYNPESDLKKAVILCIFAAPRCLSLNVDSDTGKMAPRNCQLYGLLAKDRRVNSAFPHKPVFGQYACAAPTGAVLRVGDRVEITRRVVKIEKVED